MMPDLLPQKVFHIITGLDTGGAEAMLFKLLKATNAEVEAQVLSLMEGGANARRIETLGVPVGFLGMARGSIPGPEAIGRLRQVMREFRPDLVQGWMYHGNLAAWLAVRMCAPRPRLFWNLRQTLYDIRLESRQTRWLIRLGARLSPTADKIIYNSEVSARQHELAGYTAGKRVVIPNGFDIGIMEAQTDARQSVRKEFGFAPDALLVGQVARYHPMKGHLRMLLAAASVWQKNPRARFLLVGLGVTRNNLALADQIRALGLDEKVILAGERADIARLMAAMDILVSASEWGEGFPNVVGEAMACGTPCVVTDVGDSAWVVGECGRIVPPRDTDALSKTIVALLLDDGLRKELGYKARQRIQDLFSIEKVSKSYLDLYQGKLN